MGLVGGEDEDDGGGDRTPRCTLHTPFTKRQAHVPYKSGYLSVMEKRVPRVSPRFFLDRLIECIGVRGETGHHAALLVVQLEHAKARLTPYERVAACSHKVCNSLFVTACCSTASLL